MKNSKRQSVITIGIGLIIVGVIILIFALFQPKVLVPQPSTSVSQNTSETKSEQASGLTVTYPLNLNTCTYEELMSVKGIGEERAKLILQYRDYLGGYTNVEQLKDIEGIGDETYESISVYFTL